MMKKHFGAIFQQGLYHIQHDTRCHDRAIAVQDHDLIVLALADGMGSYEYADLGAQFAVGYIRENAHEIHDLLGLNNFRSELKKFLYKLEDSANDYSRRIGVEIEDMHSTLSFAVIGPEKMVQVAIGDSPIYVKTKHGLEFLYGNGDIGVGDTTHSAYSMADSFHAMAVNVGFTKDLEAIVMVSDGRLGDAKEEELKKLSESLPDWFEDVTNGKVSEEAAVQALVDKGYDDCSFAYYVR